MSRDANGYNRYYRIKVLPKVAEFGDSTSYRAKTQRVEKGIYWCYCIEPFSFGRFLLFLRNSSTQPAIGVLKMIYLTQLLDKAVLDASGEVIGNLSDLGIATKEVFPRVTSVAFESKERKPFMLSWRKYVKEFDTEKIVLNKNWNELRFSLLQPDELLLKRDLLDKQIVDTQGMKVVRVNDLKLTESQTELRLVGADIGLRGILRRLGLEKTFDAITGIFGYRSAESLIAWSYMELLEKDMSAIKLSIDHKRLHELHPADIADIIGQLTPEHRRKIFEYLDLVQAADTISETEPDVQASIVQSLDSERASDILEIMPPDEATDIMADLPYEKAQTLLNLMGVKEAQDIRNLLGYRDKTAGGIMTTDFTAISENLTVEQTIKRLRKVAREVESIYYIYVVDEEEHLKGVLSLRDLILASPKTQAKQIMLPEVISVKVDDDQEEVADTISKYDLLAVPVLDENNKLIGIVTVDDVLEVMEEESTEDISILAGVAPSWFERAATPVLPVIRRSGWLVIWLLAGLIATIVLHAFSSLLKSMLALAFFIPLIIRLSDDISTRSVATIIQAARDEETLRWRVVAERSLIDLGVGAIVGAVAFLAISFLSSLWRLDPLLGLSVGVALALTIVAASLIGSLLQFLVQRFKIEPSIRFAPGVATSLSILALLIYLGVATIVNLYT